jgi:hypothetical protein
MSTFLGVQTRGRQAVGATASAPWIQARLRTALIARERSFACQKLDDVLWSFALHASCLIEGRLPTVRGAPGMQIYGDTPSDTCRLV